MSNKLIAEAHGLLGVMLADIEDDGCFECRKPEYDTIKRLAHALEEAEKQIPRWIPVSEKPPEGDCLVYEANSQRVLFAYSPEWEAADWHVTAWMPMPKGAEEENKHV